MIEGIEVEVDREGVVVRAALPLRVVSSAVVGGGFGQARCVVSLHVPKNYPCTDAVGDVARFCRARALPGPWVGLLTSAWTERAVVATERGNGVTALAVATVGLGNPVEAGRSPAAAWHPSTINTIVVVDADPRPEALVNLVITATECKTMALVAAGIESAEGALASGTSTDAVVVAATGRGQPHRFGGPVSDLGWVVARAVRSALDEGIGRWKADNG
ncbi:MAG: adenosylcobinamide amidohydrolase [Candidatus Rokubacteria bacterium]|nr:adenosylcobinamide amidohydrolase [Candidatus Rokubacteria bacterium]